MALLPGGVEASERVCRSGEAVGGWWKDKRTSSSPCVFRGGGELPYSLFGLACGGDLGGGGGLFEMGSSGFRFAAASTKRFAIGRASTRCAPPCFKCHGGLVPSRGGLTSPGLRGLPSVLAECVWMRSRCGDAPPAPPAPLNIGDALAWLLEAHEALSHRVVSHRPNSSNSGCRSC